MLGCGKWGFLPAHWTVEELKKSDDELAKKTFQLLKQKAATGQNFPYSDRIDWNLSGCDKDEDVVARNEVNSRGQLFEFDLRMNKCECDYLKDPRPPDARPLVKVRQAIEAHLANFRKDEDVIPQVRRSLKRSKNVEALKQQSTKEETRNTLKEKKEKIVADRLEKQMDLLNKACAFYKIDPKTSTSKPVGAKKKEPAVTEKK